MRLIDADALIEEMRKTEEECENAMTCPSWWSALSVIEKQPTAYNVDKVVEELEMLSTEVKMILPFSKEAIETKEIASGDAIEIIRRGGVI